MSVGCDWLYSAQAQGAECALDGRGAVVPGHEAGNFLGPTLLANVTMDMDVWREEIFAPVLVCLEVRSGPCALPQPFQG